MGFLFKSGISTLILEPLLPLLQPTSSHVQQPGPFSPLTGLATPVRADRTDETEAPAFLHLEIFGVFTRKIAPLFRCGGGRTLSWTGRKKVRWNFYLRYL